MKKIESHPQRQALQADLQQSNTYNPFSEKSKKMIEDMVNVEPFDLCETIPEVQCSECLLYLNPSKVYCIFAHLLRKNQISRDILRWTLDLLSIPNCVIKKGRLHGNRHGRTGEQTPYFTQFEKGLHQKGFCDRFQNDPTYRESPLSIDRTVKVCIKMDKDAQKNLTYRMSQDEYCRFKKE